jgi:Domain of unknown function (DUF5753)
MMEGYPDTTEQEVKERVQGRMARQVILTRDDPPPPRVWAVLDQQVLARSIGGPVVMSRQMDHLAGLGPTRGRE